jgi:hypothetical protein
MKTNACRVRSSIETLESRIAPAGVTVTLIDINGDKVHFSSSSKLFASSDITAYNLGDGHHDAFVVNLSDDPLNDSNLTVTVTKVKGGDGQIYVGVTAGSNTLGNIDIAGDLGLLTVGATGNTGTAINSLTVNSIGRFPSIGPDELVDSKVSGSINKVIDKGDMDGTYILVTGNLGSLSIGGSLIGGDFSFDGQINVDGNIGRAVIKHDVRGGSGAFTGVLSAGGNLGPVTVGGSIYGGYGEASGDIGANGTTTSISVGGSVYGGDGEYSGQIFGNYAASSTIDKVVVGGSLLGGAGEYSGEIGNGGSTNALTLKDVVIGGDIIGGTGQYSGTVYAPVGTINDLTVKGSVFGGEGSNSGFISATGTAGTIMISGSVFGGFGGGSGYIALSGGVQTLVLGGSLVGGFGPDSGDIATNLGTVGKLLRIDGDVRGSVGFGSGSITTGGGVTPVVLGEIFAGSGMDSGVVVS